MGVRINDFAQRNAQRKANLICDLAQFLQKVNRSKDICTLQNGDMTLVTLATLFYPIFALCIFLRVYGTAEASLTFCTQVDRHYEVLACRCETTTNGRR